MKVEYRAIAVFTTETEYKKKYGSKSYEEFALYIEDTYMSAIRVIRNDEITFPLFDIETAT